MEEVRDKHNPLTGLWCGDDLPFGREPVWDSRSQVPRLPEPRDVLLGDRGGHSLALRAGSGHGWDAWWLWEKSRLGRWSSRMRRAEGEEGMGEKDGSLSLYKGNEYQAPPYKP